MGSVDSRRERISGFTLVEILIVIVILGLVAGLAVALVGPDERDASAREARSFAGALEYAAARAQWRNEMLGVSADHRVLRYWRRDVANDRWVVLDDDDVLRAHELPPPLDAMAVAYGGRAVELWWQRVGDALARQPRLAVVEVPQEASRALAELATRNMRLQVTIHEGEVHVADATTSVPVPLQVRKRMDEAPG